MGGINREGGSLKELRASSLPKLAACALFQGTPGASEAAERGTMLDVAFRNRIQGIVREYETLCDDDKASVDWAINECLNLSKLSYAAVETREEHLGMHVPGLSTVGTADALCDYLSWLADLKTGQVRSYYEQMAAYSLACMERTFTEAWTAHVLYCDMRVRRTYEFDYATAKKVVDGVIDSAKSPEAKPTPCEYCDWCARKDACSAIVTQSKAALELATSKESLTDIRDRILATPESVSEFARQWKAAEKAIAEPVLERLRELAEADQAPGWKITEVKGREYVDAPVIAEAAKAANLNLYNVILAMGGKMSGKTFREWCAQIGAPVDENAFLAGSATKQLRQVKTKK